MRPPGSASAASAGTVESLALPGVAYQLAFTPGLITQVYKRGGTALLAAPATVLGSTAADGGGYVDLDGDGNWWIPSGGRTTFPRRPAHRRNWTRRSRLLPAAPFRGPVRQCALGRLRPRQSAGRSDHRRDQTTSPRP